MFKKYQDKKEQKKLLKDLFIIFLIMMIPIMIGSHNTQRIKSTKKIEIKFVDDSVLDSDFRLFYNIEMYNYFDDEFLNRRLFSLTTKKYFDLDPDEKPYLLLDMYRLQAKKMNSLAFHGYIPSKYRDFLPSHFTGVIRGVSLHLPRDLKKK